LRWLIELLRPRSFIFDRDVINSHGVWAIVHIAGEFRVVIGSGSGDVDGVDFFVRGGEGIGRGNDSREAVRGVVVCPLLIILVLMSFFMATEQIAAEKLLSTSRVDATRKSVFARIYTQISIVVLIRAQGAMNMRLAPHSFGGGTRGWWG
jgi:hypothetical protein